MNDTITTQCIKILNKWIDEYLHKNNLKLLEIDYKNHQVYFYKDGNNPIVDYDNIDYLTEMKMADNQYQIENYMSFLEINSIFTTWFKRMCEYGFEISVVKYIQTVL